MKKFTSAVFLLTLSCNSFAESVKTRVLDVIPTKKNNETMVLIEAQERVIWLNSKDIQTIDAFKIAKENDLNVLIDFEESTGNFKAAQLLEAVAETEILNDESASRPTALDNYTTSVVKSVDEAQFLLDTMD